MSDHATPPPLQFGARTHQGYVRAENQDRMIHFAFSLGELFVVADGMGGHRGGARAATMVVEGFQRHLKSLPPGFTPRAALRAAARRTNAEICAQADSGNPDTLKMGSTVVVLFVSANQAFVGHVGDSRAYLFSSGRITRLTRDHTLVQQLVDRHLLTEEEARDHPDSSILARAMGRRSDLDIEFSSNLVLERGDGILLCSDGLSGYVEDREIADIIAAHKQPDAVVDALVDRALRGGGEDNVTVQFVQLDARLATGTRHLFRVARSSDGEPTRPLAARDHPAPARPHPTPPQPAPAAAVQPTEIPAPCPDTWPAPGTESPAVPMAARPAAPEPWVALEPAPEPGKRAWLPAAVGVLALIVAALGALYVGFRPPAETGVPPSRRRQPPATALPSVTPGPAPMALAAPTVEPEVPPGPTPTAPAGQTVQPTEIPPPTPAAAPSPAGEHE
jgi:PPM family protein phosphatase